MWSTANTVGLMSALALTAGCNQLEAIATDGGSGGGGGIPVEVRAAFEGSCGKSGCHVPGGVQPPLAGAELDGILTGESNGVPYVTIGDTANSYIAIVMLPDPVLSELGLTRTVPRMPADVDFLNPNNQVILSWIAGAEFPGGGMMGETTGDMTDTDGTGGDMTTGAPEANFASVQEIITASCSCHAGPASADNGNLNFPAMDLHTALVGVKAPSVDLNLIEAGDPEASYLYLKVAGGYEDEGGVGDLMPPTMGLMDDDKVALIEAWILAGAEP